MAWASKSGIMLLADRATTPTGSEAAAKGGPPRIGRNNPICFSPYFYAPATGSNASSKRSNRAGESQRATTSLPPTNLHSSSLSQPRLWFRANESW